MNDIHTIVLMAILFHIDWDEVATKLSSAGDQEYQKGMNTTLGISVAMGTLAVYLGYRGAYGLGDYGHELASEHTKIYRKKLIEFNREN